nr:hypothetical protein [Ruegeria lacuscaerulensis]
MDAARYAEPVRRAQTFQSGRYIHTVAVDIVTIHDHVSEMDPDPKQELIVKSHIIVPLRDRVLDLYCRAYGLNYARKFRKYSVTHQLYNAPIAILDDGLNPFATQIPECFDRAFLILSHKTRISNHISHQNCCQTALHVILQSKQCPAKSPMHEDCTGLLCLQIMKIARGLLKPHLPSRPPLMNDAAFETYDCFGLKPVI